MRLGGAGCGVRHQGPFAIAEPRRSDAVSLRSARAALDAAQKTRGKVGVSGEERSQNGVGSGGSLAGNENKILVSAAITAHTQFIPDYPEAARVSQVPIPARGTCDSPPRRRWV